MTYAVPGSFMEAVNFDLTSNLADGVTSVFQVMQALAPDAAGANLEVAFCGAAARPDKCRQVRCPARAALFFTQFIH